MPAQRIFALSGTPNSPGASLAPMGAVGRALGMEVCGD